MHLRNSVVWPTYKCTYQKKSALICMIRVIRVPVIIHSSTKALFVHLRISVPPWFGLSLMNRMKQPKKICADLYDSRHPRSCILFATHTPSYYYLLAANPVA